MSYTPSKAGALGALLRGVAYTAATVQMDSKDSRKEQDKRRRELTGCTPCQASAYIDSLRKTMGGG